MRLFLARELVLPWRLRSGRIELGKVGWESGGFAFCSAGREALQGRQPAPPAAPLHPQQGNAELVQPQGCFWVVSGQFALPMAVCLKAAKLCKAWSVFSKQGA